MIDNAARFGPRNWAAHLEHPEWRASVREGAYAGLEAFAREARRYYPLFPAAAGRVQEEFSWRRESCAQGQVFLLDLHGTNHDPKLRTRPDLMFSFSNVPALPRSRPAIRPAPGQAS